MVGFAHRIRLLAKDARVGGPVRRELYRIALLALGTGTGPYATAWQLAGPGVRFPVGYWPWPVSLGPAAWYGSMTLGWVLFASGAFAP